MRPLYSPVYFLQQTQLLSTQVTSSHHQAISSHATTVGDTFLGAGEGGCCMRIIFVKNYFVVVDLEMRLMGFTAFGKFPELC